MDNDFNRIRTFKSKKVKNTRRDATCPSTRESLAQRIASMFKGDPRCEVIANYEKECLRNSEESIQKLSLLLENWPLLKDTPQSSRSSLFELEDALSMLPKDCLLLKLPSEVLLRIIRMLPMTTMLSLACTCKTFNSVINEQKHDLKHVHRITVDFHEFRENRVVVINIKRQVRDCLDLVERYFHCSRVPVDNELDNILFKLNCSPEGVTWVVNSLAALLTNARVSILDFIGEHGVLYEQAQSFLELCRGRRPFHIEKMTFGFTSRNTSSVAHCMFWIKLLQPRAVSFYSTVDGLYLRAKDYHNLLVQEVDRVVVHDAANLSVALLSLIIKEWFCGKRNHLPALEITFHKSSRPRLEIDELLKKTLYKAPGNFRVLIDRKGDIKEIMKPYGEQRLVIKDHKPFKQCQY